MCSDECCPPVRPDEAERAALVERITDALVRFDRDQYEGYTGRAWPGDKHRLSRITRGNDANHAAWAVLQHYAEMRRAAADELSREGQAMRLDEAGPVTFTGDEVMETVAEFNDRCEALSAGLRAMARRSVDYKKKTRWYMREMLKAKDAIRSIGEATGEPRVLGIAPPGTPGQVDRIIAAVLAARSQAASNRADAAELATLRAGRASGHEALVDALDGALVELKRLRFSVKAKHIPYPEELDEEIDRVQAVLLADPGHSPAFTPAGETTVVPYLPLAEYKARMRSASAPADRPSEPDQPEAVEPGVPWTPLMDEVHRQIEEAGAECPEHDDEPLCMSIAVGLWLQGWRTPSVAGPAYGRPDNGAPVDFNG